MNPALRPITTTTILSLGLHAALLMVVVQSKTDRQATGKGIAIELVSSSYISSQRETEQAARKAAPVPQQTQTAKQSNTVDASTRKKAAAQPVAETAALPREPATASESIDHGTGENAVNRSTDAAMHSISIVELLHTRISEHKQYPYMARRQRREGVARVEFVLHPDGTIDDTRLVLSSRTRMLDKAALEAVQGIEPFEPAKDYLEQPEAFQVDVVFNVM